MTAIRKQGLWRETVRADAMGQPCTPITRVAAWAVITNPYAGLFEEDLGELFEAGARLGDALASEAAAELPSAPISYGKAAIVGVGGDMEHGGALVHPRLGKPMREAVGGGEAVIPSNVKLGGAGTTIDLPLGHKDNPWSFDHFDTMTLGVPDAPLPGEIVMFLAYADGGRPIPRSGKGPTT